MPEEFGEQTAMVRVVIDNKETGHRSATQCAGNGDVRRVCAVLSKAKRIRCAAKSPWHPKMPSNALRIARLGAVVRVELK
ncbi:hypothetical protein BVI1335_1520015 [Burkholderia vietnamiensis]|nr:hypothetical protein BVI1335_1520015 [Burkholderia vietnamiensis]